MVSEGQFWFGFWCITVAGAVLLAIIFSLATIHSNRQYYQAYNECLTAGGSWIPTYGNNAICLKR